MRAIRWGFDSEQEERSYAGWTDDTRWNGWLNVWVSRETLETVRRDLAQYEAAYPGGADESIREIDGWLARRTGCGCVPEGGADVVHPYYHLCGYTVEEVPDPRPCPSCREWADRWQEQAYVAGWERGRAALLEEQKEACEGCGAPGVHEYPIGGGGTAWACDACWAARDEEEEEPEPDRCRSCGQRYPNHLCEECRPPAEQARPC